MVDFHQSHSSTKVMPESYHPSSYRPKAGAGAGKSPHSPLPPRPEKATYDNKNPETKSLSHITPSKQKQKSPNGTRPHACLRYGSPTPPMISESYAKERSRLTSEKSLAPTNWQSACTALREPKSWLPTFLLSTPCLYKHPLPSHTSAEI